MLAIEVSDIAVEAAAVIRASGGSDIGGGAMVGAPDVRKLGSRITQSQSPKPVSGSSTKVSFTRWRESPMIGLHSGGASRLGVASKGAATGGGGAAGGPVGGAAIGACPPRPGGPTERCDGELAGGPVGGGGGVACEPCSALATPDGVKVADVTVGRIGALEGGGGGAGGAGGAETGGACSSLGASGALSKSADARASGGSCGTGGPGGAAGGALASLESGALCSGTCVGGAWGGAMDGTALRADTPRPRFPSAL